MANPFPPTTSIPGRGIVELIHLPPSSSSLRTLTYQYPLKLVAPAPVTSSDNVQIQIVYLLTYGGGLVAGDTIDASISLEADTRLIMLTQGSTKIFKSPNADVITSQTLSIDIAPGAALCYLPDPVQPFEKSCFGQKQTYNILTGLDDEGKYAPGNLCALDWVSEGRTARGEKWDFWRYTSKNEVWLAGERRRLLLRDNMKLVDQQKMAKSQTSDATDACPSFRTQMDDLGALGTLILHGPLFSELTQFFKDEFKLLPRIGGRKWDTGEAAEEAQSQVEIMRAARHRQEAVDGLLWTVSSLRGCTVVKFGAREVEGGKRWLTDMLESESSVVKLFGERALLCLR